MDKIFQALHEQKVNEKLLEKIEEFRKKFPCDPDQRDRIVSPEMPFYGRETFEMAAWSLLNGENILLTGTKATGKNVLAQNLSYVFGRPVWDISFHVNLDAAALIGADTFKDNEVQLRPGPVYDCARYGGFGIFDEINMAKNDAVSVLHALLDYRRILDIPGYEKIHLDDAARFIGTMNYGYAGTRELNEALVSRFLVIEMPSLSEESLHYILTREFPDLKKEGMRQMCGLFLDLKEKADHAEITTRPVDLRGLIGALRTIRTGLDPLPALRMGLVNKTFDPFERQLVEDIVRTRIPESYTREDLFEG